MLAFLPGHGFEVAASTLVGQNLGAGQPDEAERQGWRATLQAVMFLTAMSGLMFVIGEPIARWFIDEPSVIDPFKQFIVILALCLPMLAIDFALAGALRGAGDTRTPMVTMLTALIGFRLIPGIIVAHVLEWQIVYLWSVMFLDFGVRTALLIWAFRRGRWKLKVV